MYLTLVFLTVTNILYILAKIAKVTAEPPVPPAKSMPNLMSSDLHECDDALLSSVIEMESVLQTSLEGLEQKSSCVGCWGRHNDV
jgi:hypothetical protein